MPDGTGERPLGRHTLTSEIFTQACSGPIHPDTLSALQSVEYSRRKLLLRTLFDLLEKKPLALGPLTGVPEVWQILSAAENRAPEVVKDVLMYPTTGAWAIRVIRRMLGAITGHAPRWTGRGEL